MKQEFKRYIYIDADGIDSLYRQLPNTMTTTKTTTIKSIDGEMEANLEFGFLKPVTPEFDSKIEAKYRIQKEKERTLFIENKIDTILKNINNGKIDRLFDTISHCKYEGLIACKALFRFISAYDEDEERYVYQSDINRDPFRYKHLSFLFASTPYLQSYPNDINIYDQANYSNEYYVDMFFSNSKMVQNVRHLNNNIKYQSDFTLHVLGDITAEGNGIFCLKPYAIWRMNDKNV